MADAPRRYCRKCLLREIDEAEYFAKLHHYIERIPADEKADPEEYGRRLAVCKECGHLQEGTCLRCGCYVEVRAAVRRNRCPDVPPRWDGNKKQIHDRANQRRMKNAESV